MTQAVHVRVGHALHAVAAHGVRLGDGDAALQEKLDDLVVVGVGGQDDGGDVRSEVGELFVQQDKWHLVQRGNRGRRRAKKKKNFIDRTVGKWTSLQHKNSVQCRKTKNYIRISAAR